MNHSTYPAISGSYTNVIAGAAAAPAQSPITLSGELEYLSKMLDALEQRLVTTEEKLQPVLTPCNDGQQTGASQPPQHPAPLVSFTVSMQQRVGYLTARLDSLLLRLPL